MAYEAVYFDGETARDNRVGLSLDPQGITFLSEDGTSRTWSFAGLQFRCVIYMAMNHTRERIAFKNLHCNYVRDIFPKIKKRN